MTREDFIEFIEDLPPLYKEDAIKRFDSGKNSFFEDWSDHKKEKIREDYIFSFSCALNYGFPWSTSEYSYYYKEVCDKDLYFHHFLKILHLELP